MTILTGTSTIICVRACEHASVYSPHVDTKCSKQKRRFIAITLIMYTMKKKNQIIATRFDVCQYSFYCAQWRFYVNKESKN